MVRSLRQVAPLSVSPCARSLSPSKQLLPLTQLGQKRGEASKRGTDPVYPNGTEPQSGSDRLEGGKKQQHERALSRQSTNIRSVVVVVKNSRVICSLAVII